MAARCTSELVDLQTSFKDGQLSVKGRLVAQPAAYGVVAYNDWTQIPGDYDALGLAGKLNENGEFGLVIDELQPGQWDLRLRVCHLNGGQSHLSLRYQVDAEGKVEADELRHFWRLAVATQAFAARDVKKVMAETQKITAATAPTSAAHRKALHLQHLLRPPVPLTLAAVPDTQATVLLSRLTFEQAAVGWRQPLRDRVPTDEGRACLLEVAGQFFEDGLYAHAPSRYVFNLKGQWQALKGQMGVQDGFAGSVRFVIKGDGRELLRSKVVKEGELERFTIDVSGMQQLELITEDGGDGANSDWGVWLAPSLHRTL